MINTVGIVIFVKMRDVISYFMFLLPFLLFILQKMGYSGKSLEGCSM